MDWQKFEQSCVIKFCVKLGESATDFFLFSQLKNHLKGRHFGTLDNIQKSVTDKLEGIPAEAFQQC